MSQEQQHASAIVSFGFWLYLMTDLVLFASLFAVYAVLQGNTVGGPAGREIFSAPFVLTETIMLLVSSLTAGLSVVAVHHKKKNLLLWWLAISFVLGGAFLALELSEFIRLVIDGNGPGRSAFLSSYFTLVGTHGLHIFAGLLWLVALVVAIMRRGLTTSNTRKLFLWSMFWHFLDLVWIFIFSIVYLMGLL